MARADGESIAAGREEISKWTLLAPRRAPVDSWSSSWPSCRRCQSASVDDRHQRYANATGQHLQYHPHDDVIVKSGYRNDSTFFPLT